MCRIKSSSLYINCLSERFTLQTVNYFTCSAKTTDIATYTKLTVYLGILKVHTLLNGTILYASELARIFLLMLFFYLMYNIIGSILNVICEVSSRG